MRYRLDSQHYIDDKLLEEGTEIGDGTPFPWRFEDGTARPPSRSMVPLDDEAKRLFKEHFKTEGPVERDPTKAIPVQGKPMEPSKPASLPRNPEGPKPMATPKLPEVNEKDPGGFKNPTEIPGGKK